MNFSDIGPVVLVGAGKMGLALARSWIAAGLPADRLVLCDPAPPDATVQLARANNIRMLVSPVGVLTHVLVLAVKPQQMRQVMEDILPAVGSYTLVISIAAGVSLATLAAGLDTDKIVRAMPNTPAQVGKGITGAVALKVAPNEKAAAELLLGAAGQVVWFEDETQLDAVTAVSGSGPAYVFHLVEALALAGKKQGLSEVDAMRLARQTVVGAAALLEADPAPAGELRANVTSPNGTTAAALSVLMGPEGMEELIDRAVAAARRRSEELGRS